MKRPWIALAAGLSLCSGTEAALDAAAAEALMKKNGCTGCHEVDKVKKGGTHVWGEAAMPPNVLASDADVRQLVDWMLGLAK